MALQYARRMGFRVAAGGRGRTIAVDPLGLGAHLYVKADAGDSVATLKDLGGAGAIITTVPDAGAVVALLRAVAPRGGLVLLGAGADTLPVSAAFLVSGERNVLGSMTGSP